MEQLTLENPVFVAYLIASALMVLKVMGQGWMTVQRMLKVDAGLVNPEDIAPGPTNRNPRPEQLDHNDYVDRSRRMHRNDLENIPGFWMAGFIYVVIGPPVLLAQILFYGFVVARMLHAWAYVTAKSHEVRATFYTVGSLIVIFMAIHALVVLVV
ncbi:MAPEG family protein [Shimia biformata]|uniref:MAPEG family protein n=1 Tax=Shimia biformata TaxID=1294299 RepID=UPI001951BB00|nr:MAPEG family protein [Shimia biformata]